MAPPALRPLSNLEILDGGFTLYRRNFVLLVGACLVCTAPAIVLFAAGSINLSLLANWIGSVTMIGAIIKISADATLGQPVSLGGSLKVGLSRFFPLAINLVIYGILITIGFFLLIIGGIFVGIMGFAIAQVVVIESRWDGFARSRMLAKKAWGRIAILTLLSWLITFLPQSVLIGSAAFAMFQSGGEVDPEALQSKVWLNVASMLLQCLTTPFTHCVLTLLYFDQRVRKEGLGIEMQAAALQRAG